VLGERRGDRVRGAGALAEAGHLAAAASAQPEPSRARASRSLLQPPVQAGLGDS
jgi:hypothetical protein